jgi:hypothetical protein
MSFSLVNAENVHLATGFPLPKEIENIAKWLLNDKFQECFKSKSLNNNNSPNF